jgi:hypothetical protein
MQAASARMSGGRFPASPKRPPATRCQLCRVELVTRKELGNLTDARAGKYQSELDAALSWRLVAWKAL